jgi:hypothetical protein
MRILFICKRNEIYGQQLYTRRSAGLFNSTRFIVEALREQDIKAHIVEVQDNNDIDREVSKYKPNLVVLEALWVVPEKFPILMRFHPKVKWFVHLHSDMPFLALEGNAIDWIIRCAQQGVGMITNSEESYEALKPIVDREFLHYLPNVYLSEPREARLADKAHIDIGCFGAIRPLKNHLLQALASVKFAQDKGMPLRFHVNTGRVETGGEPVLKNLRSLFRDLENAKLIEHHWFEPEEFLNHLQRTIDIGLQVSLTETFNVVTADYVTAGLPVVVSKEVKWVSGFCQAEDNSLPDIVSKMHRVWGSRLLVRWNQVLLHSVTQKAAARWIAFATRCGAHE